MDGDELLVGPEAAGERLDVFLAPARGLARGGAAADRRRAGARRRRGAPEAPRRGRGRAGDGAAAAGGARARGAATPRSPSPTRTTTCWWSTSRPAWSSTRRAGTARGTLAQALAGRIAGGDDPRRAGIVHRLDRDTSGLLVVARTEAAHAALKEMLRRREVTREYLALVEGRPAARAGTIDAPIGPRPARAHADLDRHRRAARGDHALRGRAGASRASRSCACGWRPAARTRSAPTCWPSATRSPATPSTAAPACSACRASSCTRSGSPSQHPATGSGDRRAIAAPGRPAARAGNAGRSTGGRGREGRPASVITERQRRTFVNWSTIRKSTPGGLHPTVPRPRPCPAQRRVREPRSPGLQASHPQRE